MERNEHGQFVRGNPGGPGNPHAVATARNKAVLLAAVTEEDLRGIVRALIDRAVGGDVQAAKLVLDRVCGREQGTGTTVAVQTNISGTGTGVGRALAESIVQKLRLERDRRAGLLTVDVPQTEVE